MKLIFQLSPHKVSLEKFARIQMAADDVEKVSLITGKSAKQVGQMTPEAIEDIIEMFDTAMKIDSGKLERILKIKTDRFRKTKIGFIPDFTKISLYEHIDLDTFATELSQGNYTNLEIFASILFRPITRQVGKFYEIRKYDSDNTGDYIMAIRKMPIAHIFQALVFFSIIRSKLQSDSLEYSRNLMTK